MHSHEIAGSFLFVACLLAMHPADSFAHDLPDPASTATAMSADSASAQTSASPDSTPPTTTTAGVVSASFDATPPPDRFAFADNALPWKPLALGVGIGAGAYTADLQEVDRVFRAIENAYRAQGWAIPAAPPAKLGVMRLYSMTARIEKVADITVQLGRSGKNEEFGDDNQLQTNGVILSRRIVSSSKADLALVAGAGGGTYGFVFNRTYSGSSPVDTNGVYTTLDLVELQGGGTYWTALGGFKIRPGRHFAIDLQAQYIGMKPASANTPQTGEIAVDLSGYCLGASFAFFL